MNREQTLALWRKGQAAWNDWASQMLAEKEHLEKAGTWRAARLSDGSISPMTTETYAWLLAASADFSSPHQPTFFNEYADFQQWYFPGEARFAQAEFKLDADFTKAIFLSDADFSGSTFSNDARFDQAKCLGEARFRNATFGRGAIFDNATFSNEAWFREATFQGPARFVAAIFETGASFDSAKFEGFTTFARSRFLDRANFSAIRSERAFTIAGATFKLVPDFIQAHFAEAPRLDNSHFRPGFIQPGRFWSSCFKRLAGGDPDVPARWRALKRLAIQGHDHEREQIFFPMEIRSARFVTDWPLHWRFWDSAAWNGVFRFWFGIAYQIASNFGRSILRPTLLWTATILLFAGLYLGESEKSGGKSPDTYASNLAAVSLIAQPFISADTTRDANRCAAVSGQNLQPLEPELAARTDAVSEALHLAVSNGSVLGGIGGAQAARRTYGCLFGFVRDGSGNLAPIVPANISNWSLVQKTISIVFIFLFGLALRNMLKVQ